MNTKLWIVIPCYNKDEVLPITAEQFLNALNLLYSKNKILYENKMLFVNDGSKDNTWKLIKELSKKDEHFIGICKSRNRGHQNQIQFFR